MLSLINDVAICRKIAASNETSSDNLDYLKEHHDKEVRRLIALNPNASTQTLLQLAADYPDEVTSNDAFSPSLLDQSHTLYKLYVDVMLARSSIASPQQLEAFSQSTESALLVAVSANHNTPVHVLERLFLNSQAADLARRKGDPSQPVLTLFHFWEKDCIARIASNPSTPVDLIRKISGSVAWGIADGLQRVIHLARNPKTPIDILEKAASYYHSGCGCGMEKSGCLEILRAMVSNPSTPAHLLNKLIGDAYGEDLQAITKHPNTPGTPAEIAGTHRLQQHVKANRPWINPTSFGA